MGAFFSFLLQPPVGRTEQRLVLRGRPPCEPPERRRPNPLTARRPLRFSSRWPAKGLRTRSRLVGGAVPALDRGPSARGRGPWRRTKQPRRAPGTIWPCHSHCPECPRDVQDRPSATVGGASRRMVCAPPCSFPGPMLVCYVPNSPRSMPTASPLRSPCAEHSTASRWKSTPAAKSNDFSPGVSRRCRSRPPSFPDS